MNRYSTFCLLLVLVFTAGESYSQNGSDKPKLAFGEIKAIDMPESLAESVRDMLQSHFTRHFVLLDRAAIDQVMEEHAFQQMVAEEIADAGRILGADKMIFGSVKAIKYSTAFSLSLRMVDVEEARIELAEFIEIIPRVGLDEAISYIAEIFTSQVPLTGSVTEIRGDTITVDMGKGSEPANNTRLSVFGMDEGVSYEKAVLDVVGSSSNGIVEAKVRRTSGMIMLEDSVATKIDRRRLDQLRNKLESIGDRERNAISRKKRKAEELDRRKMETELIQEERRKREAMTLNKLRLGAGWFVPWIEEFKDEYVKEGDEEEFTLDHPVYSLHLYPGTHRYYRFYWKISYWSSRNLSQDMHRRIGTLGGGVRIQFPIEASRKLMLMPYGGTGLDYTWMMEEFLDREPPNNYPEDNTIDGIGGMGREFFVGFELVLDQSIGLYAETLRHWAKVGEDELQVGGEIIFIGVDVWF